MHITKARALCSCSYDKCGAAVAVALKAMTCLLSASVEAHARAATAHINNHTQNEVDGARAYRALSLAYIYTCMPYISNIYYTYVYCIYIEKMQMLIVVALTESGV